VINSIKRKDNDEKMRFTEKSAGNFFVEQQTAINRNREFSTVYVS